MQSCLARLQSHHTKKYRLKILNTKPNLKSDLQGTKHRAASQELCSVEEKTVMPSSVPLGPTGSSEKALGASFLRAFSPLPELLGVCCLMCMNE